MLVFAQWWPELHHHALLQPHPKLEEGASHLCLVRNPIIKQSLLCPISQLWQGEGLSRLTLPSQDSRASQVVQ